MQIKGGVVKNSGLGSRYILILCCFHLLLANPFLLASNKSVRFKHLNIEQGLSQSSVYTILQDDLGYMWFGTQQGLNRFDGFRFRLFDPKQEKGSVSGHWIWDLEKGLDGSLWLGTKSGLYRYNPRDQTFTAFHHNNDDPHSLSADIVRSLFRDKSGRLWIGTQTGGLNLQKADGRFQRFLHDPARPDSLAGNDIYCIAQDRHGRIWVGTHQNGVSVLDPTGGFTTYVHDPDEASSLSNNQVRDLMLDHKGRIWVATQEGLNLFDQEQDRFVRFMYDPEDPGSLSHNQVQVLFQDDEGDIWVGTDKGLNLWDENAQHFYQYYHDPTDASSLSQDNIRSIYQDRGGVLWVGTNNGIDRWDMSTGAFAHYKQEPTKAGSLAVNSVLTIAEDPNGSLWVGTYGGGLNNLDREKEVFTYYQHKDSDSTSISDNRVSSLLVTHKGVLWAGTFAKGLNRLNRAADSFDRFVHDPKEPTSLSPGAVTALCEDSADRLWIATFRSGLNKWNGQGKGFTHFKGSPESPESLVPQRIVSLLADRSGKIWIGSDGDGLNHFDPESGTAIRYSHRADDPQSLGSNKVSSVYEDRKGHLWVATMGSGLSRWLKQDRDQGVVRFKNYTQKSGLCDDVVFGILDTQQGYLWLSTNHGLSRFNMRNETFRNYNTSHGLQSEEFNFGSYFRCSNGDMVFGGINGFNVFNPKNVRGNLHAPEMVISDLKLLNKSVPLRKDHPDSLLLKSIDQTDAITLSYLDDVFSLEFAALHFAEPGNNKYQYKLEGLNSEWILSDATNRVAAYTTLKAGTYTFRVKGCNNDGVWNEEGASLKIFIEPPPWQTAWAYAVYVAVLLLLILGYLRYQQKKLEDKQVVIQRLQKIDKLKDDFLANTSHELRTPLNGIIGLTESLLDGAAGPLERKVSSHLTMVASSGRRLAYLVDDILDFSKLKNRGVELSQRAVDFYTLTDVVLTLSRPMVGGKGLKLVNDVDPDEGVVWADENRLLQIMHNLVGNAIKFTEEGVIRVSARREGERVVISVSDTGIGIAPDRIDRIFESFEQVEDSEGRVHGGAGLGLAITRHLVELHGGHLQVSSTQGKGSDFTFSLAHTQEQAESLRDIIQTHGVLDIATENEDADPTNPDLPERVNGSFNILIVDDEPVNLQVLVNHLSLQKYNIIEASTGQEALDLVEERADIDLILLDIMMPRLSGYEVCRKLRKEHPAHELPIIFLTARNQLSDLVTGFGSGANDYLTKPVAKKELLCRVNTHLRLLDITRTLEERVLERTRELKSRHEELITLDRIVKTVNREMTLERVLNTLLEQGLLLFPQAEKAAFVLRDSSNGSYKISASVGYDFGLDARNSFSHEQLINRYCKGSEQVERGVYLVRNLEVLSEEVPKPLCLLSMEVVLDDELKGFLIFNNFTSPDAFDHSDLRKLIRLREHAIAAVAKAGYLQELQEKNEEIMRTQNQLIMREKMVSLGTLTAGIAHEIKNPLNFINNFSSLNMDLCREVRAGLVDSRSTMFSEKGLADMIEAMDNMLQNGSLIHKHGERANHIVQSMMLFSREGGERESMDLNLLVDEYTNLAYRGMQARHESMRVDLVCNYGKNVGRGKVVVQGLGRVLISLVTNALEAVLEKTQREGEDYQPEIAIKTFREGKSARVVIRDNGGGINPEYLGKVFTPFFTTKTTEYNIGLGLFISYDIIVQEHHGELAVESLPGEFTEFTVILPD